MFCQNCGTEITEGKKFCGKCGTPIGKANQSMMTGERFESLIVENAPMGKDEE